jgi:hypothetical protein
MEMESINISIFTLHLACSLTNTSTSQNENTVGYADNHSPVHHWKMSSNLQ